MKTRAELKAIAKKGFYPNYWKTVAVVGAVALITGALNAIPIAGSVLTLLIALPLSIGMGYYFLLVSLRKQVTFSTPFKVSFSNNYLKYLGGSLWMGLWTFLWSLLFIIPGIIKSYSYAMTPYILADCPDVSATDALKVSKRIMDGHKFEFFVLQLSFLGWVLLCGIGMVGFGGPWLLYGDHYMFTLFVTYLLWSTGFLLPWILYVGPYIGTTYSTYYKELMDESIRKGIVTEQEIGTRLSLSVADAD